MIWTEVEGAGDTPSGRDRHSMTVFADGTVVLFGGVGSDFYNDVYSLTVSGTGASWVRLTNAGDIPGARSEHTMTAFADGIAVLFGGFDGSSDYLDDVYSLTVSGTHATWASLTSQGDTPSAPRGHSMTALADGTVVLLGGDGYSYLNVHTVTVSGTTASWVRLTSAGDTPAARAYHTMTALADGTAVLFGASGVDGYLDDVHTLTVSTTSASWVRLTSAGDTPAARAFHTMTALADGTAVLFGASGVDGYLDDVHTLTVSGTTCIVGKADQRRRHSGRTSLSHHDGACRWHSGPFRRQRLQWLPGRRVYNDRANAAPHVVTHSVSYVVTHSVSYVVTTASPTLSPTASPTLSPTASLRRPHAITMSFPPLSSSTRFSAFCCCCCSLRHEPDRFPDEKKLARSPFGDHHMTQDMTRRDTTGRDSTRHGTTHLGTKGVDQTHRPGRVPMKLPDASMVESANSFSW